MKTIAISLFAFAAIFLFSGCKKMKEKTFSTTILMSFEVDKDAMEPLTITLDSTITSLINEQLNEVKDNIKSYELVGISYKVFEFWTDTPDQDVLLNGELGFGNLNATVPGVVHQFTDVSLLAGTNNTARVKLNFNSQDLSRIEQYFMDTNGMKIFLDGDISSVPTHFVLSLQVDVNAVAETKK